MKRTITIVACATLLSGCASTLRPIGLDPNLNSLGTQKLHKCNMPTNMSLQMLISPERFDEIGEAQQIQDQRDEEAGATKSYTASRLDWLSCEMLAQSMKNFNQSASLANRTEWRDLPLIGSALTIAGLVLFGNRGADGNLSSGDTDVIEGIALGAAGYTLLAQYANPQQAAELTYQSARGHRCLAEHGQAVATYGRDLTGAAGAAMENSMRGALAALRMAIKSAGTGGNAQELVAANTALERGEQALAFFMTQRRAREAAPAKLYLAAYDFGMKMTRKARREPVQLADIQSSLRQSIELQRQNAGLVPEGETDDGEPPQKFDGNTVTVSQATRMTVTVTNMMLTRTPNIAPLVAQFDLCTDLAILGGTSLPKADIRYGPEPK